jgi:hypothetical protein
MWDSLTVASPWVSVRRGCTMTHRVCAGEEVEFTFDSGGRTFEFAFDGDALRQFVDVATTAVYDLETHRPDES